MTVAQSKPLSLIEFLQLPETEPASEYVEGEIIQKPMARGKHSRLQSQLCETINQAAVAEQLALALPELRCTFEGRSLVPDVAVFAWERIPFDPDGEVPDKFELAPDWIIEILSPEQSQTRVIDKILFCLQHQTQLGWLIDPTERAVICYFPDRLPQLKRGAERLPVLASIRLDLTVADLFGWLKLVPLV